MRTLSSCLLLLALSPACNNGTANPSACTAEAEPAVVVALSDATTGDPIEGATLTLSEGPYQETMQGFGGVYSGGFERPGTYDVSIAAAGYASQVRTGVVAPALQCGPETQLLAVQLQPVTTVTVLVTVAEDRLTVEPVTLLEPR